MRRIAIATSILSAILAASPPAIADEPAAAPSRPNILIIMADDMGYSDLGCYGGEIPTPRLDRLAAGGLRFTQFYNTARCCPTRASLLTGLYSHQAGIGHMTADRGSDGFRGDLNDRCVTIAEALRPAGYRNYAVGKWHVTKHANPRGPKHNWPLQRGFDRYYGTIAGAGSFYDPAALTRDNTMISPLADPDYRPETFYYTDAISDHAVRFIADHQSAHASQPFFLYVAYTSAHWPMQALDPDVRALQGRYDAGYDAIRQARFAKGQRLGTIDPSWTLSPTAKRWEDVPNKSWEARGMEVYAAMVASMDRGIGRIVDELERRKQLDNTLILYLQDNGGCAEVVGRQPDIARPDKPTFPTIAPETVLLTVRPKQTRGGFPMLSGRLAEPGPHDTYIAYGEGWANVSNTPFRLYKHYQHEGGISTPLIAHWPARIKTKGELRRQPGHLIDLMATCVDIAGAKYPRQVQGRDITPMQGRSLVPAFDDRPIERDAIYWEHEGNRAIREGDWKLAARGAEGAWELYDLKTDRTEMQDLAARHPDKVLAMTAKWEAWAKRSQVLPWIWFPPYGEADSPLARQSRFDLAAGTSLAREQSPRIADKEIAITAEIADPSRDGVIVSQGGGAEGFSLFLRDGKPTFAIRRDQELTTIAAADPLPAAGSSTLKASLSRDGSMRLEVDGRLAAEGNAGGLLAQTPIDGLQVGKDLDATVGPYPSPFPYSGTIRKLALELK